MTIRLMGDLNDRVERNAARLYSNEYKPPAVFGTGQATGWPGDKPGRALLALCCLYRALDVGEEKQKALAQAADIVRALPKYLNEFGYFGLPFDSAAVNEQQLAGNSWFLRGLCAYYRLTGDTFALEAAARVIENYVLQAGQCYAKYPIAARGIGGVGGHLTAARVDGWALSSDVGCAFILMDGVSDVHALTKDARLVPVMRGMIKRFFELDIAKYKLQTHAALSALRGAVCFAEDTGDKTLLSRAEARFGVYLSEGLTLDYANYNWFGMPSWTEPCTVVDSILLAATFFRYTQNRAYLRFINRVYHNALRSLQRTNGGAGCQTCLTHENNVLKIHLYEADFCCTMRLAEGLLALKELTYCEVNGDTFVIINESSRAELAGGFTVSQEVVTRDSGSIESVTFTIENNNTNDVNARRESLKIYVPQGVTVTGCAVKGGYAVLPLKAGRTTLNFAAEPHIEQVQGRSLRFLSDMLLTRKGDGAYSPVTDCFRLSGRAAEEALVQSVWDETAKIAEKTETPARSAVVV